jgi:hypothetical protein
MSTRPGETLAAMAEMSDGAPAPVEVLPDELDEPEPEDEDPLPEEPEPNGYEPLPEPEPNGDDPLPLLPEPADGLAADEVVEVVGHTA